MTDVAAAAHFERQLRRTLQALALPGADLDALVPPGASIIGELVVETPFFAEGYQQHHPALLATQRQALAAVVAAMEQFASVAGMNVYQYDPADEHPAWQAVQRAAWGALAALQWSRAHPGSLDA